jgi:lysophospholipase L1-like esterase
MNLHRAIRYARRLVLLGLTILMASSVCSPASADEKADFSRWEKDIAEFENKDKVKPPPKNAFLFVGSSSIRLWDLAKSFPGVPTINRGFGGSQLADSVHFAERIVLKYEPRVIVLYAGDNDLAAGKSPEQVHRDFQAFVQKVHKPLPRTPILYLAIKPSLRRWHLIETIRKANALIEAECKKGQFLLYVDVATPLLGKDGKPQSELFAKDGLHLNEKGYAVWAKLLQPHLKDKKTSSEPTKEKRRVLAADKGHVAIVNDTGEVEWEFANRAECHDLALLPNNNVLLSTGPSTVVEVTPEKKIVWRYEARPVEGYKGRVEVHAFQRLADGRTLIAESGNRRLVEVDRDGKVVKKVPLTVEKPDPHRDTRMVRKLENGHYLVCHEGDGVVREYDGEGKVVWSYRLGLGGRPRKPGHGPEGHGTELFGAIRLASGNTLIAGGNNNRVLEVTPAGEIVWEIGHDELPGIRLAWVTMLQVLPNGNVIVGNCHAGPDNPQLFEITRDKKVVWTFRNFKTFGNSLAAAQVLGIEGVRR